MVRDDGGIAPHVVHLHEQPRESLQEWAKLNVADPVAAKCMSQPGVPVRFHAPTLFAAKDAAPMRSYAKRFGRQSYMVCGVHHPVHANLLAWLSLYRRNPDSLFTDAEQRLYRELMTHLNEAQEINRRLQLHRNLEPAGLDSMLAIADVHGYLHTPPGDVETLCAAEWAHCEPGRLPSQLLDALASDSEGRYFGNTITVRSRFGGGLLFVRIARRVQLGALTLREQQIAEAIARGASAKEAAKSMGLSPATVRAHLQNIYKKLALHSQAELAFLLGRSDSFGTSGSHERSLAQRY